MIPLSTTSLKTESWQQQLGNAYCRIEELLIELDLAAHYSPELESAAESFSFRVPGYFAGLMEKGNIHDPLLLQVLPSIAELQHHEGFSHDPLADLKAHQGNGILHKYHGRVLLITTAACAINCRYCFRRHFPYSDHQALKNEWADTLSGINADSSIHEVILSGGDPLTLSNARLKSLVQGLETIPHVRRLRIHTRLPVVLPDRIEPQLVSLLGNTTLATSMVIHANHPNELTPELAQALAPLHHHGIILLNQAVLLKNINDDLKTQAALSESLFDFGVLPYYLHQLDHVQGAAHFAVEDSDALHLHSLMEQQLPGYLLPRLVREIAGKKSKHALSRSQNH
jgi:EF-P beta-lysylation protein EpmB